MKVTLNWLKQYVEIAATPEELREQLTMLGIEVEKMEKISGEFEGVVVAQILSSDKHPNADKLSVCRVADGRGERQIVCGAKNYQVGDKVPLALPGCTLPTPAGTPPFTIKVGKLRGVESQGMMCSGKELGLSEDAAGLMILPAEARVGQVFAEYLGRSSGDVIYDLEITPNRPDLNSLIGIAREISALTGHPLRLPEVKIAEESLDAEGADSLVSVRIGDADLCPRYTARVVRGIKIGPSPDWLRLPLERVGQRSINNVVDVTNFVMMETGQPLHAFDYHLVAGNPEEGNKPRIVIRRAAEGEKFTTLDGQERALTNQMLVIADLTKAIALAGVMGGLNSEIKETTVDVIIESACFKPQNIRATSKKLDLRSDASYRFERGSDIGICDWASLRAAQLMLQTGGGRLARGVVDAFPALPKARQISLRPARTNQILGIEIPEAQQSDYLKRLGLSEAPSSIPGSLAFGIPTFRVDLKREIDLIEEVARLYGVDRIPVRAPRSFPGAHPYDAVFDQISTARRLLSGLGLDEIQSQTLVSEEAGQRWMESGGPRKLAALRNPLSADMGVLRPSLRTGLLDVMQRNLNRKNGNLALFDLGRVFLQEGDRIIEENRLAIGLTGMRHSTFWMGEGREARYDLFDLKGMLETFFELFGIRGITFITNKPAHPPYLESAQIKLGKDVLGEIGQLSPPLAKRLDLRDAVLLAEINFDLLLERRNPEKAFKPIPAYPAIRRDLAMLIPEAVSHDEVLAVIKQAKSPHLEKVELFDVFRGKNVPEGQKSMAYAFIYRSPERTLTDAEVNGTHEKLVEALKQKAKAVVREG